MSPTIVFPVRITMFPTWSNIDFAGRKALSAVDLSIASALCAPAASRGAG